MGKNMSQFQLSKTATELKRSVMRDLIPLAVQPGVISLAGGLPTNECLPVDELRSCTDRVLSRDGFRALQYGPPFAPLRDWLAEYMRSQGVNCLPENIFITNGAQQSLAILSRLFADRGDSSVIESITFTGIHQITQGRGLRVTAVPTNLETGVSVNALAEAFAQNPHPKFAVLIPNFHNPLGVTISVEKRRRIVELAAKYQVPIIEDDPYSPLRFKGESIPLLSAIDEAEKIIYVGSFSKMLAPAARLGWIVAPKELGEKITVLRESFDLESSQLVQRTVTEFLTSGGLESNLARLNTTNSKRCTALMAALKEHFEPLGAFWTKPEGGLFAWITLPEHIDASALFQKAVAEKVAYIPGNAFAVEGGFQNTMRVNFSNATSENIREGVRRLAKVIESR